ncbi:type IV pilus biogenesis/stability protein PilW [Aquabacterium sp. A7-Y]|uniref:type IV pilus biogenesis/stability protein PilW n=1 Tax=Aquabacterium sp. A7-Y TaxID=1349605 RepID=UPI00223DE0F2|nr:type IV pilus biogenesis/stability protein PilW [Aquabacterium sp. A7-Y]MCW7540342.1 type IV pilus biogenesis/stability protein PilW [Aquabacterium sp. A7-Y]
MSMLAQGGVVRAGRVALLVMMAVSGLAACGNLPPPGSSREIVTTFDETENQKRARIRLELASAYFGQGQTTTALDELKQALQADPNMPQAYNLRGLVYASLNEDQLAEESFRRALQLNGRDGDVMQNYGWFLCQRGRYNDAYEQFDRAIALPQYREAAKTQLAKGVCQARAGSLPAAEQTLTRSYELDPGNPATSVNLADVLYRRGEFERARFYIRRVNNVPQLANAETLWLAARIEHKLGNTMGAMDYGNQLKQRYPQSRQAAAFEGRRFDE